MSQKTKQRLGNILLVAVSVLLLISTVVLGVLYRDTAQQLKKETEHRAALEEQLKSLEGQLDVLNAELKTAEEDKKQSEDELLEKQLKIESLETMIDQLNASQDDLSGENEQLASRLEEANRTADELRDEISGLEKTVELRTQAVDTLKQRGRELHQRISALKSELNEAQTERMASDAALDPLSSPMTLESTDAEKTAELLAATEIQPTSDLLVTAELTASVDDTPTPEITTMAESPVLIESWLSGGEEAQTAGTEVEPEAPVPAEPEPAAVAQEIEPTPEPEPVIQYPQPEPEEEIDETDPEKVLLRYMKSRAPLRWTWKNPNSKELIQVYPSLSYFYLDLENGDSVSHNADEIRYAASLVKAPYIYSVLREIEAFEAGEHERDADGKIIYKPGEEKYDLDAPWIYDPATMAKEGSGEIQKQDAGFTLKVRELFEYALLYSDNVAFSQLYNRFGFNSFYSMVGQLGIQGSSVDFMDLSARDCAKFLTEMYHYFESDSPYAAWMHSLMTQSKLGQLIAVHYPEGTVAHKYGWDVGAFHDMAIIYDEHPYLLVIMTDYSDGSATAYSYFAEVVGMTKLMHATSR